MIKKIAAVSAGVLILGLLAFTLNLNSINNLSVTDNVKSKKSISTTYVLADREVYTSLKDLKNAVDIVVIGTVEKELATYNGLKDLEDPTKENTEFPPVMDTDYMVVVEKYFKGSGDNRIIVTQENTADRMPMEIGRKYVFFVDSVSGKYMFGGEPYKFQITKGKVKADTSSLSGQDKLKEMAEKDFFAELQK